VVKGTPEEGSPFKTESGARGEGPGGLNLGDEKRLEPRSTKRKRMKKVLLKPDEG